jgi:O-succinylbenzoic acid--CoA ligase
MNVKNLAIIGDYASIEFKELSSVVSFTAKHYYNSGIDKGKFIAILADNSVEYVITIFALWKLGAVPVPINTRLTEKEISDILYSVNPHLIICDNNFAGKIKSFASVKMQMFFEGEKCNKTIEQNPNDIAVIIYTSGSSGKPKGVMITNENLYQSYLASTREFKYSSADVFVASLPFYHIGGFAIINRMLLSGGSLVIPKSLKTAGIVEAMKQYNPSIISLVPTMLKRILENNVFPNNNLRLLFLGGGPSDSKLIFSAIDAGYPVVKVYGSSETTAMVTFSIEKTLMENPASAGKPFYGVTIKITDKQKNELPADSVGEIAIKSSTIAKGYFNATKLWKNKIVNGFYYSGDYGYIDKSGLLFVLARRTDLIISGGENINPLEIEEELLKHPAVKECVVFPVEDKEWGQVPVAAIVSVKKNITETELREELKTKLASFKIPSKFLFVTEIPRSVLGKVKIEELKKFLTDNKSL